MHQNSGLRFADPPYVLRSQVLTCGEQFRGRSGSFGLEFAR
jgi:hypothetical protein